MQDIMESPQVSGSQPGVAAIWGRGVIGMHHQAQFMSFGGWNQRLHVSWALIYQVSYIIGAFLTAVVLNLWVMTGIV